MGLGTGLTGPPPSMQTMTNDSTSASPPGRVGHLLSVYVFGGLTYDLGSFPIELPLNGSNSIVVWRACRLDRALEGGRGGEEGGGLQQG
jgi:hypothetical protein